MTGDRWLPMKHPLPDGSRLERLLHAGSDWQIYQVSRDNKVLIVQPSLAKRWLGSRLLMDTEVGHFAFGDRRFVWLPSGLGLRLEPANEGNSPARKLDCLSFVRSIRETRDIETNASIHDAIYSERCMRLLPIWSVSEEVSDERVLGCWLTGGVSVAATSHRRVANLLSWLDEEDVRELVREAGFEGPQQSDSMGGTPKRDGEEGAMAERGEQERAVGVGSRRMTGSSTAPKFRLFGRPGLESFFSEHVIDVCRNAELYRTFGIEFPASIVLHGPPGCGKTFAVEQLAEYLDWPTFHIDSGAVGSPYIHETSRKIGSVFEKAIDASPSMVIIDEMESYLSDRQIHLSTGLHHVEEVAEFLRRIPEANRRHVLVIGMTNRLEMIDSAILRRGRFDHVVEVNWPSAGEVSELVDTLLANIPCSENLNTKILVDSLVGRPLSDVAFVVREAARLSARAGKDVLYEKYLLAALENLPAANGGGRPVGFCRD